MIVGEECFAPSALLGLLLLLVEFETIFPAIGLCVQMSGAIILPTFTVPRNIMKIIIATNPALANFLAYEILSSNAKKEEIANSPTIGTAADTKTDLFGNSNEEKEDIVKSIRMPEITVASTMIISLALRFAEGPGEVEWEGEGDDIFT
jgi:ABC-type Fe3+-siderophore transport system permease subunit